MNELKNKILEFDDELSHGDIKKYMNRCYLCGRITYDDYPIINYLCTQECKKLYESLNKMEVIEISHELHYEREEQRKLQKKEFSDRQKQSYESGNYEISEFSQHMTNKYKD